MKYCVRRPKTDAGKPNKGQENCCNSNETNWNKSTNSHCFLWTRG